MDPQVQDKASDWPHGQIDPTIGFSIQNSKMCQIQPTFFQMEDMEDEIIQEQSAHESRGLPMVKNEDEDVSY